MSVFDDVRVSGNIAMSSSECHKSHENSSLGLLDMTLRTEVAGVFFRDGESFSD